MEFIEVIEKIGNNSEELETLLKLKKFDEVYQLLKKNGYKKSPEMLRKDVEELTKEGLMNLENVELSRVSGGRLKENINKATSLGMASLLMLGASPMGPKASATGFRSSGVKAPVSTSIPVNSSKEQVSSKKLPFIPLIQGDNVVKAIGAVAAVVGVGALGYGARTLQDKIFKPTQEPEVKTVEKIVEKTVTNTKTIKEEKLIDYRDFIENYVGKCDESDRTKIKACVKCIQEINNILGFTDTNSLQSLTYEGYDINSSSIWADDIGCFLCHAVTGCACGRSVRSMNEFQRSTFLSCLRNLVVFEAFAEEFQDSEKHEKIKQCIGCLIDLCEEIEDTGKDKENIRELRNTLELLLKFSKNKDLNNCAIFHKKFSNMKDVCNFVAKLHNALEKKGINDGDIESIKIVYGDVVYEAEGCTLDDVIAKELNFFDFYVKKVMVKCIDGITNTFDWNNTDGTLTPEDDTTQTIQE